MRNTIRIGSTATCVLSVFGILSFTTTAWGWGERGHNIVGSMATKVFGVIVPDGKEKDGAAKFFRDRATAMGHLSNIPDISWRDGKKKRRIAYLNAPTHFFGPEDVLGVPESDLSKFQARVRALPTNYEDFRARYEGKENPLPGVPPKNKKIVVYEQVGVLPWRVQEMFSDLVSAFKCAKAKEGMPSGPAENPFREPRDGIGEVDEPPLPTYVCKKSMSRKSDLHAAVMLAGIMGHFVGDMAQPFHPTSDYDGWSTGNGGIHSFFESSVVTNLDEQLELDVFQMAADPAFRAKVDRAMAANLKDPAGLVQLMFNMAGDSIARQKAVRSVDQRFAVTTAGTVLKYGDHPKNHASGSVTFPKRKSAKDAQVLEAFRPLIVERLAVGTYVLARVWVSAWEQAGRPKLGDMASTSLPYPTDPSFVWPAFDSDALDRSKNDDRTGVLPDQDLPVEVRNCDHEHGESLSDEHISAKYPKEWWVEIPKEGAPDWEILPQEAGPGEVILSKRTELGVFSNFAATPFSYRGKTYASVEGFWQAMKYPEGPDDPRAQHPGIEWKYTRDQVAALTAFEAKTAGDHANENMKKMGIAWVSFEGVRVEYKGSPQDQRKHYRWVFGAIQAKVLQNPAVKALLLKTQGLVLKPDHKQDPQSPPAYRYHEILMRIRAALLKDTVSI